MKTFESALREAWEAGARYEREIASKRLRTTSGEEGQKTFWFNRWRRQYAAGSEVTTPDEPASDSSGSETIPDGGIRTENLRALFIEDE